MTSNRFRQVNLLDGLIVGIRPLENEPSIPDKELVPADSDEGSNHVDFLPLSSTPSVSRSASEAVLKWQDSGQEAFVSGATATAAVTPSVSEAVNGEFLVPLLLNVNVAGRRIVERVTWDLGASSPSTQQFSREYCQDCSLNKDLFETRIAACLAKQLRRWQRLLLAASVQAMLLQATGIWQPDEDALCYLNLSVYLGKGDGDETQGGCLYEDRVLWDIRDKATVERVAQFAATVAVDFGLMRAQEACIAHALLHAVRKAQLTKPHIAWTEPRVWADSIRDSQSAGSVVRTRSMSEAELNLYAPKFIPVADCFETLPPVRRRVKTSSSRTTPKQEQDRRTRCRHLACEKLFTNQPARRRHELNSHQPGIDFDFLRGAVDEVTSTPSESASVNTDSILNVSSSSDDGCWFHSRMPCKRIARTARNEEKEVAYSPPERAHMRSMGLLDTGDQIMLISSKNEAGGPNLMKGVRMRQLNTKDERSSFISSAESLGLVTVRATSGSAQILESNALSEDEFQDFFIDENEANSSTLFAANEHVFSLQPTALDARFRTTDEDLQGSRFGGSAANRSLGHGIRHMYGSVIIDEVNEYGQSVCHLNATQARALEQERANKAATSSSTSQFHGAGSISLANITMEKRKRKSSSSLA